MDGPLVCVCASGRRGRKLLGGNATTITLVCPVRLHDRGISLESQLCRVCVCVGGCVCVCGEEHWVGMLQEVTSPFGLDSLEM